MGAYDTEFHRNVYGTITEELKERVWNEAGGALYGKLKDTWATIKLGGTNSGYWRDLAITSRGEATQRLFSVSGEISMAWISSGLLSSLSPSALFTLGKAPQGQTVYRTVSAAEAQIIRHTGKFSINYAHSGVEVKYFANSVEDAHFYEQRFYSNGYEIIEATVIKPIKANQYWYSYVDIGAHVFPKESLHYIIPK